MEWEGCGTAVSAVFHDPNPQAPATAPITSAAT
jgi:hypothetical protein